MKNKIVIFGAGKGGEHVFKQYSKNNVILAFCDNSAKDKASSLFGKKIISPSKLSELEFDQILIASQYSDSIFAQLIEMQLDPEKIKIIKMEQLAGTPENVSVFKKVLLLIFLILTKPILRIYDSYKRRECINSCTKL